MTNKNDGTKAASAEVNKELLNMLKDIFFDQTFQFVLWSSILTYFVDIRLGLVWFIFLSVMLWNNLAQEIILAYAKAHNDS